MLYLAKEYFGALLNEQAHPTCPTPRPRSLVSRVPYATSGCNCTSRIPVGPRKWRAVVRACALFRASAFFLRTLREWPHSSYKPLFQALPLPASTARAWKRSRIAHPGVISVSPRPPESSKSTMS